MTPPAVTRFAVATTPRRLMEIALLLGLLLATTAGCVFVPVGGYGPRPGPVIVAPPPPPVVVAPWPRYGYGWRRHPYWW